jgi:radical SAM/Cys-rich protein
MSATVALATSSGRFRRRLDALRHELRADGVTTLQLNVGRICNQACRHCHVEASPARTELMSDEVLDACLDVLARHSAIATLDITAGAPELHPRFRELVERGRALGKLVMVRHNLTVQFEPGQEGLPEFFARHAAEVISSLPHYLEDTTDRQRGRGVFDKSIRALRALNLVGYGQGNGLKLTLVANPVGAFLPPSQSDLERDMRDYLTREFGVAFDQLFTITNMPIGRFADWLRRAGLYEEYLCRLDTAFNPRTLPSVMCRSLVSVNYDGRLHDCDFNQMLEIDLAEGCPRTIFDFNREALSDRLIRVGDHCLGCTAGGGSSCGGALE